MFVVTASLAERLQIVGPLRRDIRLCPFRATPEGLKTYFSTNCLAADTPIRQPAAKARPSSDTHLSRLKPRPTNTSALRFWLLPKGVVNQEENGCGQRGHGHSEQRMLFGDPAHTEKKEHGNLAARACSPAKSAHARPAHCPA